MSSVALGVAWVEPAHMAAERDETPFRVVRVGEVVVAARISAEFGIVSVGREGKGRA
ncbi:hypothetical protein ACRAWG_39035 (plasmid) [Methylobacterium sp. P31]